MEVLVVDNNPVFLRLLENFLAKAGHEVLAAGSGLEALRLLESHQPVVIFIDLVMPNIGGDKLCQLIRSKPGFADVLLVILSAVVSEEAIDLAAIGADFCIAKGPLTVIAPHLTEALELAGSRRGEQPPRVVGAAHFEKREITQELLTTARHYRAMLANLAEGVLEVSLPDARVTYANPAALDLLAKTEAEVLAAPLPLLFSGPGEQIARSLLQRVAADGQQLLKAEQPIIRGARQLALSMRLVAEADTPRYLLVLLRDITEYKNAEYALKVYNADLDQIFNTAADGMVVIDREFTILRINGTMRRMLVLKGSLVGRKCFEVFPGAVCHTVECPMVRILEGETRVEFEEEKEATDGRFVPFLVTATPYRSPEGDLLGIVEDFRDITERKRWEKNLQESEERYRDLFENASDLIQSVTPEGRFLYVNRAWREALGYTEAEVKRLQVWDIIAPEYRERCRAILQEVMVQGVRREVEAVFLARDGRRIHVLGNVSCKFHQGTPLYTRGIFADVTARKRAEEELHATLATLRAIYENSLVGILVLRGGRTVADVNPRLSEITGYRREELLGQSVRLLHLSQESFERFGARYFNLLAANELIHLEYQLRRKDGTPIWCLLSGKALNPDDLDEGVIWVIDEITQRKQLEEQKQQLIEELQEMQEALLAQSIRDPLTGLFNRRYLDESLRQAVSKARRHQATLGVVLFDIDHFKRINDQYGHLAGDTVLRSLGALVQQHIRGEDIACRYGGEEFAILFPGIGEEDARRRAEELREMVARDLVVEADGQVLRGITISLGVAVFTGQALAAPEKLIATADAALYQAKKEGRNRVVVAGSSGATAPAA